MPDLLTFIATAVLLSIGFGLGWVVRAMLTPDLVPAPPASDTRPEYGRGYDDGYSFATTAMREEAERLLAERFPTSTGGRRIVKALGGTVPPMPRVKRNGHAPVPDTRPVIDMGEGEE